jgi:hypothetical protein
MRLLGSPGTVLHEAGQGQAEDATGFQPVVASQIVRGALMVAKLTRWPWSWSIEAEEPDVCVHDGYDTIASSSQ